MKFTKLNKQILKIFIISIIVISIILIGIDLKGFKSAIESFNYKFIIDMLIFTILNYIFRFIKWNFFLSESGVKIPILENIKIFLASLPMTITPGKFGEVIKSYFLKVKYNYPISITAPIVLVERISDTIGMLILGVIGAILFNFGIRVLIVIIGITILGIVVLQSRSLCNLIINLINIIPFIRKYVPKIKSFYENTNNLLKARIIICAAIIGMVTWSFEGMVVYSAAKSVNINTSIIYSIFIQVFSSIVGAVSMLPGGVVASEGGILALLIKLGVQSGTAGFIILLVRFFTLWLGVIVGSIVLLKIEKEIEESGFDLSEINSDNNSKM